MEKKLNFREWYFQKYKEYPENPSRRTVRDYIDKLTLENFDDTFDKLKEYHEKVKEYFQKHNIKSEPIYELNWDFDVENGETTNEHGLIFVYYLREENDYEFNERIEKRENDAIRLYDAYEMNYEHKINEEKEREEEEYQIYLRLKDKFKNRDDEENDAD